MRRVKTEVIQGLGRDDQVALRGLGALGANRDLHLGEPMTIRGDHPHTVGTHFPEHTVQDGTALFGADGERGVRDEPLQIARRHTQRLLECHGREARELTLRQPKEFELGASALKSDALITRGGDLDRRRRELACDLGKFSRGNGDGTRRFDISGHLGADRDVEIGAGHANPLLGGLHQKVREHWKCRLGGNGRCDRGEPFLQLLTRDGESHSRPVSWMRRMWIPRPD